MAETRERWSALDAFRGLTVLLMLPVNAGLEFDAIPGWLKHAPGAGMRLADFIMPAFLVALGLSSSLSLKRRLASDGFLKAALHALSRYGLLFLFGTIGFIFVWRGRAWEVLQMLGATGALAFPFLFLPPIWRILAAFALGAAVELLRPGFLGPAYMAWYDSGLGGPWGTLALARLPILASAVGELVAAMQWKKRAIVLGVAGEAFLTAGFIVSRSVPPDKHLLTPAYLLISLGAAFTVLALMEPVSARFGKLPALDALGRNPLFAYLASGILILVSRALVPASAGPPAAWAVTLGIPAITALACIFLERRSISLRL